MKTLTTLLVWLVLSLVLAAAAGANTAAEARLVPYSSASLFRAPGVPSPDIWNAPIAPLQPLDPNSKAWANGLAGQMGIKPDGTWKNPPYGQPLGLRWINSYNVYVTNAGTVWKTACSRFVLQGRSWSWNQSFHNATVTGKVPVPPGALAYDGGADHSMAIYDPPSNTYWEFFVGLDPAPAGTKDPQGRPCDFLYYGGGRLRGIGRVAGQPWYAASPGYFRNNQPAEEMVWGRQATGAMPVIGGLITPQEWNAPSDTTGFGHAISVVVPWARCGVHYWPAQRNDCGAGGAVPEGALMRFAPTTNCARWDPAIAATPDPARKLYLRRVKGVCTTGKIYGFRVVDQSGVGFALKMRYSPGVTLPDGGSYNGQHWANEYLDPLRFDWGMNLQVMANVPHPTQWSPGCLC